jgi:hypothetical protein
MYGSAGFARAAKLSKIRRGARGGRLRPPTLRHGTNVIA